MLVELTTIELLELLEPGSDELDAGTLEDEGATDDDGVLDVVELPPPEPPQPTRLMSVAPRHRDINFGLKPYS
ncbi:MAG: hypothetical protein B0W54_17130 [Cellvibrio sp. 79]|nr:MAG: hypothetical protein B0W54_17130 [Cellvibrio sp. 79]